jgi:hypothetical protein
MTMCGSFIVLIPGEGPARVFEIYDTPVLENVYQSEPKGKPHVFIVYGSSGCVARWKGHFMVNVNSTGDDSLQGAIVLLQMYPIPHNSAVPITYLVNSSQFSYI